jgi:RNA polymerase-binding transcription factor DksA
MTRQQTDKYRAALTDLAGRLGDTAAGLEEGARQATGGAAGGNESNAPLHLGDLGTAMYTQELNATLLENEVYLRDEVAAALGRLDAGTFGRCEACAAPIPDERLAMLPYVRYCVPCAERIDAGAEVNLNRGRPEMPGSEFTRADDPPLPRTTAAKKRREVTFTDLESGGRPGDRADPHAAGTAGGGTAVGGLAGTNVGHGDPDDDALDRAAGSGNFDVEIEADEPVGDGYGGPAGGAVGGSPAGKRAAGGTPGRS